MFAKINTFNFYCKKKEINNTIPNIERFAIKSLDVQYFVTVAYVAGEVASTASSLLSWTRQKPNGAFRNWYMYEFIN